MSPNRVRELRLARGFSQDRVSIDTGIRQPDLSALERGQRPLWPSWRVALARAFGVDEADLDASV